MTPERAQQIDDLFHSALEREHAERASFLAEACDGDEELRQEVESLLASYEETDHFISQPLADAAARLLAEEQTHSLTGRHLGRYQILNLIGAGGMGEVYLAEDRSLGRRVAIKLLPALFTTDKERVRRFQREAYAVSALNHPNILTIHEIGQTDSLHFIATEFVDGVTLREHMRGPGLGLDEALDVAVQIASALAVAHEAGIVHRDIKPENVMLRRRDGIVKVLDFGLAKLTEQKMPAVADPEASTVQKLTTHPGMVMGTVTYMSPEQARGLAVDSRTDVWSLGVALYEMVTGHAPFKGETMSDVLVSILDKQPSPLANYLPEASPRLQQIVERALYKDREGRYQSAEEMAADLRRLRRELEDGAWRSVQPTLISGAATEDGAAAGTAEVSTTRSVSSAEYVVGEIRRHKLGAALAIAILAITIAGVVFSLYKVTRHPRPSSARSPREMKITKLTNNGQTRDTAISPDGKYVAYVVENEGQQNLWLKHITTDSSVPITPPDDVVHRGLTFSPDSSYILYATLRKKELVADLFQVPVLGGTPKKLLSHLDSFSSISFSPDGKRFAFIRDNKEEAALMIANADGTEERKLASRKMPQRFIQPAWSPDGKTIASPVFVLEGGGGYFDVLSIEVEGGEQKPLFAHAQRWQAITKLAWLGDGSALVVLGRYKLSDPFQLWQVTLVDGEARRITNDLNSYSGLSLTSDSKALVTVQNSRTSNIWVVAGSGRAEQITSASTPYGVLSLSWTPDGRIIYSRYSGNHDIWIMGADGKGERQITSDAGDILGSAVSADGRYIVFESWRNDIPNLWRVDTEGGNLQQLTSDFGGNPESSPTGPWVVYWSNYSAYSYSEKKHWKRVHIDGGDPLWVTDKCRLGLAISPDGSQIACRYSGESKTLGNVAIIPFEGGEPVKFLDIPEANTGNSRAWKLRWTADGRALTYIQTKGGISNIWNQPVDGAPPVQLTDFKTEQIFNFAWSRDGQRLALARGTMTSDVVMMTDFR